MPPLKFAAPDRGPVCPALEPPLRTLFNYYWVRVFYCVLFPKIDVATVAEWYRHRIVAGFVTSSSPVPLKTRRVGQRCTLNLSRAETSSRWCGVVVRRGGASSGVVRRHDHGSKLRGRQSPRVAEQCDVNLHSLTPENR
ncbi:uncharacterized protein TNCV_3064141 [Trichonephila clavipes]|nr:uncharacterized protein TNCV_3064141 [Trichonephila clavipes]